MYVWARLIRTVATIKTRGKIPVNGESKLDFRCLPFDIDTNMHLNNARYLMLADLGRIDLFFRSGLVAATRTHPWTPLMGGVQTAYVREIKLWREFSVISRMVTWKDTSVIGRHRFVLKDGTEAATVLTTAGIYDYEAKRFVPMEEVARVLGHDGDAPEPDPTEQAFMETHRLLRAEVKKNR